MELYSAIVASHKQWEKYTLPMIDSFRVHEPDAPLIIVDCGSEPAYYQVPYAYTNVIRTDNESHAKGINLGFMHAPISKWYITLDNDTLVTGSISKALLGLDENTIYGAEVRHWRYGYYAVGWCFVIPRKIMLELGLYDENYIKILYEETDYCYRAEQAGFKIKQTEIPVVHVGGGGGSRKYVDSENLTEINRNYFIRKYGLTWE